MGRPVTDGGAAEELDLRAFTRAKMRARKNTERSKADQKIVMEALKVLTTIYTREMNERDVPAESRRKAG